MNATADVFFGPIWPNASLLKTALKRAKGDWSRVDVQKPNLIVVETVRSDHPCDARCTGAVGLDCSCSCNGANHGIDNLVRA